MKKTNLVLGFLMLFVPSLLFAQITSVSPNEIGTNGGLKVSITGTNLGNGTDITSVTLKGVSVTSIDAQIATQVIVIAAAGTAGTGDVVITSTSLGIKTLPDGITYVEPVAFAGGDGTSSTPYQVSTADQLNAVRYYTNRYPVYFEQTADINLNVSPYNSGLGWAPIGDATNRFFGTFDGQGFTISNLFIDQATETNDYIGLFGYFGTNLTTADLLTDIHLVNVNVTGGDDEIGSLAGYCNSGVVSYCSATGIVKGDGVNGSNNVGGLIGNNQSNIIRYCYCSVNVSAAYQAVGGITGRNQGGNGIYNSYSNGSVTGYTYVGGIAGYNSVSIMYSYSTGAVSLSGGSSSFIGGLTGSGGSSYSFWDTQTSGQTSSSSGTGKTTDEMKTESISGWGWSTDIWERIGYNYPRLQSNQDASLPVELTSFTAENQGGGVLLKWCTESEIENLGFIIGKRKPENGDWTEIADYRSNPVLEGHGSTTEAHEYQFTDNAVQPGVTYEYRLGDVDYSGNVTWHGKLEIKVKIEGAKIPTEFGLQSAYPNPFNPSTTISYQLASASFVKISIYDVRGKLVETLVNEQKDRGNYSVVWDAGGLSSGIYIYKITAGEYNKVNKCLLIR